MATLRIRKVKRIRDEVTLLDLGHINYIVGRNASGKSSVIDAVEMLRSDTPNSSVLSRETEIEFIDKETRIFRTIRNDERLGPTAFVVDLRYDENRSNSVRDGIRGHNPSFGGLNQFGASSQSQLDQINETLAEIFPDDLYKQKIEPQISGAALAQRIDGYVHEGHSVKPELLSLGTLELNRILSNIAMYVKAGRHINNQSCILLLTLEEPENNLHPELQRRLPKILNRYIGTLEPGLFDRTYMFITTHSPFLVSAGLESGGCVYAIQDGALLSIDHRDRKSTLVPASSAKGISGADGMWLVAMMLGADQTGLGYPENFCLLEEASLQTILDDLRERGIVRRWQFISCRGNSKVPGYAEQLEAQETLLRCNLFYRETYRVIVDNISEPKVAKTFSAIRARMGERFKELSKSHIEDYYKNIDMDLFNSVKSETSSEELGREEKGALKRDYAGKIAALIKTQSDFTKLFEGELDFLLPIPPAQE